MIGNGMRFILLVFALAISAAIHTIPCSTAGACYLQSKADTPNWRTARMELEKPFVTELESIAAWSRDNGNEAQALATLRLSLQRDLNRQYLFLPSESSRPAIDESPAGQWRAKIHAAQTAHAERIFELAKTAAQQDAGAIAYQLLHEVIHHDLDHAVVRKMLGHRKSTAGWMVASDSIRIKKTARGHDVVQWPAGTYIRVLTPHFEIESNASAQRTTYLAEQLERGHLVWRQVFFEYWSSATLVKSWLAGSGSARTPNQRFRVVFFENKPSYVQHLAPIVRGIGISSGYYSSDHEVAFFYDGDASVQETWRHELTHQLFRETGRAKKSPFEQSFICLDEGVAAYFESMVDFGAYVTLGGFDARRMQFARRLIPTRSYVPIQQLTSIGRTNLQQRTDVAKLYSESAAVADMLMNSQNGKHEQALTEFMTLVFKRRLKAGSFEKIIGKSFEELDQEFVQHMSVEATVIRDFLTFPESRTELAVPGTNLDEAAMSSIGKCHNLTWLDLSQNPIGTRWLSNLDGCQQLRQLMMVSCQFEANSLAALTGLGQLDELDLSGSNVTDSDMSAVAQIQKLALLRLASTNVTDQGLQQLVSLKGLQYLDVSGSRVTARGIAELKARLPKLKVIH
ncbi:MAG: hypothetical protein ACI87E_002789 [Mariniblastus sp.]|jgi:hypothetical protein